MPCSCGWVRLRPQAGGLLQRQRQAAAKMDHRVVGLSQGPRQGGIATAVASAPAGAARRRQHWHSSSKGSSGAQLQLTQPGVWAGWQATGGCRGQWMCHDFRDAQHSLMAGGLAARRRNRARAGHVGAGRAHGAETCAKEVWCLPLACALQRLVAPAGPCHASPGTPMDGSHNKAASSVLPRAHGLHQLLSAALGPWTPPAPGCGHQSAGHPRVMGRGALAARITRPPALPHCSHPPLRPLPPSCPTPPAQGARPPLPAPPATVIAPAR